MRQLSDYRAAIFDLDGTLIHSEPAWEEAKRRVMARLGVTVPQAVYDAFVGRGVRSFLAHVMGPELSPGRQVRLGDEIGAEADILLPQMRAPVPGAADFVRHLAGEGLRLAVCSSSPRRHIHAALEMLRLSDVVGVMVSGADLPRGKPDPLPYLETLRLLDLPARQAFAVEDALPGALSAHAAGLAVIGIGAASLQPEFAPCCALRVAGYADLARVLPGL